MVEDIDIARLHKQLEDLRENTHRGESVRKFGGQAGISPTQVAQMEGRATKKLKKNTSSAPTIVTLYRYLKYCEISLTDFFAEFEDTKPRGLTANQVKILNDVRALFRAGEDVEHRLQERIEDVKAWLRSQPPTSHEKKKRKGSG